MPKNFLFKNNNKHYINELDLNKAKKAFTTHEYELVIDGDLSYLLCKKCNYKYIQSEILNTIIFLYNKSGLTKDEITFNTCDENVIKALVE